MTRSPDDIFAAQFWAWPDPALKRDPHGRVIFVNAAFLQMFGGSVEAWQGQVIQGWSAPQPGPQPYRFEIRTPSAEGYPEQVYDWLESCGADGNGFALARNVTAIVEAQVAAPAPAQSQPPQSYAAEAPQVETPQSAAPAPSPQPVPDIDLSSYVAAASAAPEVAPAPEPIVAAPPAAPFAAAPLAVAPEVEIVAAPPLSAPAAQPSATLLEVNPHDTYAQSAPERDFERRALPLENEDAVLGNNWRDAVIAKAIGGGSDESDYASADQGTATTDGAIRILLAEDNAINALLTRTLLEADGHSVDTVEDGVLAVEAMKTQDYDMIFMDMRMPNMDGLEATRKIRALSNVSKDLPIVALTANAFDDDRNACFDSGMNDFMTKPVSAEELSEMVVRWTTEREQRLAG
ncbi:response regulator [Algimonas arctica]|nr:response regulator [Algimonas arctica]